jgi:hypothetical protein
MSIITFKMWEDAAANSAGGGGIDGIGVGAKGEPGVHKKRKKEKEKELLLKMGIKKEDKPGDWEKRSRKQQDLRKQLWKKFGQKVSNKK